MDEEQYQYATQHDIPRLMDAIAERLMSQRPQDPYASVVRFLNAKQEGGYSGGAALAGTSVGSGWLRIFGDGGSLRASVDRIPLNSEGELQLVSSCNSTKSIFLASVPEGGSLLAPNTVVRRYSFDGDLLNVFEFPHAISCIAVDRKRDHLWVLFKHGGGHVVQCHNGSRLRDVNLPSATSILFLYDQEGKSTTATLWILTSRSIEKRDPDTLQIDLTIHLPDSMLRPLSFTYSRSHIWCASANADGSTNFSSSFERSSGRVASSVIPPPGSIIAPDFLRKGTWHASKHSANGLLTLMNINGVRLMTMELKKWRKANLCVDKGSGYLWLYRDEDGSGKGCRCTLFDPFLQKSIVEHEVPEVEGETTILFPL